MNIYGTVQAQVYTRARVKHRALACRGVRAFRVLDKDFDSRTNPNVSLFARTTRECIIWPILLDCSSARA